MVARRISLALKGIPRIGSDGNLTKKAVLNATASILDFGVRLVVGFIVTPLLVAGLGNFGFGVWQVLSRLTGYINPAGGRSAQALKWTIASKQSSTDYDEKRRLVGSAIGVWLLFLPLVVSIGAAVAWFAPMWLNAPANVVPSVRLTAAILVATLIMLAIVQVPRAVLMGENLGYKRMGLSAALVVIGGGFTVLALYLDTGLIGVATAHLATSTLTGLVFIKIARKHVPWFGIARPSRRAVRDFLRLSGWFLLWGLVMRLMTGSDIVILGIADSPELVTTYALTRYVPETLISVIAILVFGVSPGLGGVIGSGDLSKASRIRSEMMSFTWLVGTVLGGTILLWNQSFIGLWVGPEHYAGSLPTLLIVISVMQFVLIRNESNIIDLTLELRRKVLIGILSTTLAISIACILVGVMDLGIVGLCIGFIVGRSILTVSYPWIVSRYLGISLSSQLKEIVRPAFITLLVIIIMSYLGGIVVTNSWLSLILCVGLTLLVATLSCFFAGLSHSQRHRMWRRIRAGVPILDGRSRS